MDPVPEAAAMPPKSRRRGPRLVVVAAAVASILAVAALLPAAVGDRCTTSPRKTICANNMKRLGTMLVERAT